MATGDSKVTVKIEGDADGLSRELKRADGDVGRFGSNTKLAGAAAAAGFLVVGAAALEFGSTALAESDRVGDATERLELQLGDLSDQLVATAGDYSKLGQSRQDMLELEAATADVASALGVADPLIASFADEAAATAAAVALLGDQDAATVVELIGKAADGSEKALKALGINMTDAEVEARALADTGKRTAAELTAGEIAAAGYALVLEKLKPKLDAATDASTDLEQGTLTLQAKFETFTGVVGEKVEGPLSDLLTWFLGAIDAAEELAEVLSALEGPMTAVGAWADDMKQNFKEALGPIQGLIDAATFLIGLTNPLLRFTGILETANNTPRPNLGNGSGQISGPPGGGPTVNINVQPSGGADFEKSVVDAIRGYQRNNPL